MRRWRRRRENNKIVEEGIITLRRENIKIVVEGIKKLRANIKIVEEGNCQTGYTNHERHKIKIEHDVIDKPVKLDILNEIPPQVNEIPQHFIHEIKTKGYDVIGVNLFLPKLMKFPRKKPE